MILPGKVGFGYTWSGHVRLGKIMQGIIFLLDIEYII